MAEEGVVVDPVVPPVDPATPPPPAPGTPHPEKAKWDSERQGFLKDLQKERQQRQAYEAQIQKQTADLDAERRRVAALAGVNIPTAEDAETEQVKKRFGALFPHLADLTAEDVKALREMKTDASGLRDASRTIWEDKARHMVSAVETAVAKDLGGDLSERQVNALRRGYMQAAQDDPDFLKRHIQGDPKLVEEFSKQWIEDWFEPARRKVIQQQVSQRRPVPGARDRSVPGTSGKQIDVKDPKAVEDFLVQGFKERGGQFGR